MHTVPTASPIYPQWRLPRCCPAPTAQDYCGIGGNPNTVDNVSKGLHPCLHAHTAVLSSQWQRVKLCIPAAPKPADSATTLL